MLADSLLRNATSPSSCTRCPDEAARARLHSASWRTGSKGALDEMLDNPLLDYGDPDDLCPDCFSHIGLVRRSIARRSLPRINYRL